jgi:hypothetical protein
VRLKALLPAWMPGIRKHYRVRPEIERQLLRISARQMDRRLNAQKAQRRRIYGHTKPGYLLKHHIPVKTDRWDVQSPGFTEVDLVSHSGHSASGDFVQTLNVTDIHTTWTDSAAPATTDSASFSITIAAGAGHSAMLKWTPGPSPGVIGYNVYRSTISGSGYSKIDSSPVGGLSYTDASVVNGQTY